MIPVGDTTELDFETLDAAIEAVGGAGGFCRQVAKANAARTQNLAMIARDEPKFAIGGYVGQKFRYELDPMEFFSPSIFERLGGHGGKKKVCVKFGGKSKPAITGLTTVHDGKARGLGFCSDGY